MNRNNINMNHGAQLRGRRTLFEQEWVRMRSTMGRGAQSMRRRTLYERQWSGMRSIMGHMLN